MALLSVTCTVCELIVGFYQNVVVTGVDSQVVPKVCQSHVGTECHGSIITANVVHLC